MANAPTRTPEADKASKLAARMRANAIKNAELLRQQAGLVMKGGGYVQAAKLLREAASILDPEAVE